VPWRDVNKTLRNIKIEVELGFDVATAWKEAQRCLNCDVQTVFNAGSVHRVRCLRRHLPDGLHHVHRQREEADLRKRLTRAGGLNLDAGPVRVRNGLKTGRVMVKDEDVCLHCGLCAERCPTGAWDMQKFLLNDPRGPRCRSPQPSKAA
jgi:formate dehydrogenase beta subunit